jgi:translation initiation factor IF-3
LDVRLRHAQEFLGKRHKVKFTLFFRGREAAHMDLGRKLLEGVKESLKDFGSVEEEIKSEGKRMTLIISPK